MSISPKFIYYAAVDLQPADGDAPASGFPLHSLDGFATIAKIASNIAPDVCDSTDVFVISRIFRILYRNMDKLTTADFVYFMKVFTLYPTFTTHYNAKKDPSAIGSFFIGLLAAKMLKDDTQAWMVGVSDEHLISLAGLHCFFVHNMRIAHLGGGAKTLIELQTTYKAIFDGVNQNLSMIIDKMADSSTAPFSTGFQLAKLIWKCNATTAEGVLESAKYYDVLLDKLYTPMLIMKS